MLTGLAALALLATAGELSGWRQERAVMDSLSRVHPRLRASWLQERGLDDSYYTTFRKPDSTGLKEIGRWPWGPSWELAGRDSLLFLGSGSGVRILSITDSVHPRMLGQINARGLVSQVVVRDSLLFVACGSGGAQIYSIGNPTSPRELGSMGAVIYDLVVKDTFCYTLGIRSGNTGADSLRIYSIANPEQPRQLGAVRDSGYSLAVTNGYAFSGGRWLMNVYDVRNPSSPQWVNSRGGPVMALRADGNKLYHLDDNLVILNVSNPLSIGEFGRLNGQGGRTIYTTGGYAYIGDTDSGFVVVDVSDSTHPVELGRCQQEGFEYDPFVFEPSTYAYQACTWGGLTVIDIHNTIAPLPDSQYYGADLAQDVFLDGLLAYIADDNCGLFILDVTDPSQPVQLAQYDTVTGNPDMMSVVARDSFAFVGWRMPRFHSVDVTDPSHPLRAGFASIFNPPQDMVLRDSLVYIAEANRFQVINVARPRNPVLVGSCVLPGDSRGLVAQDTVAYVTQGSGGLYCINVASPAQPAVLGSWTGRSSGVSVVDTVAFVTGPYTGIIALSIADPANPRLLDSLWLTDTLWWNDVVAVDSVAYVGGERIWAVDVRDPQNLRLVPGVSWMPPYLVRRLVYVAPYLYAACYEAGVCVLETTLTGIKEWPASKARVGAPRVWPSITSGRICVEVDGLYLEEAKVELWSATGERKGGDAMGATTRLQGGGRAEVDLTGLPAGVYVVRVVLEGRSFTSKVVKTNGR